MKKPRDRGAPVDPRRFERWLAEFGGYRNPVTLRTIELWLEQFAIGDRNLAARVLDAVLFVSNQNIHTNFRNLVNGLEGWSREQSKRKGRWFFVPFSGSAGESGDAMVHTLRMALSMGSSKFNNLFIHRRDLIGMKLGPSDTVVLVDDFSGTGNQAAGSWKLFETLLVGGPTVISLLVVATEVALGRITAETEMEPKCAITLRSRDNVFSPECTHFTAAEKNTLLGYCKRASPENPRGYGDSGLLLVLAHRTPNNSIPILHESNGNWDSLFPRHD